MENFHNGEFEANIIKVYPNEGIKTCCGRIFTTCLVGQNYVSATLRALNSRDDSCCKDFRKKEKEKEREKKKFKRAANIAEMTI